MTIIGSRKILGKDVYSQDGNAVGEVTGFDIDVDTWRIESMGLKLNRDVLESLKLKKPVFGTQVVRIEVSRISGVSDKVILKDDLKQLQFVPVEE